MATYYSCNGFNCGSHVLTDNPKEDKYCEACITRGANTPPLKIKERAPRFIRICKTTSCDEKLYNKDPKRPVEFCYSCRKKRQRNRSIEQRNNKRVGRVA